MRPHRARPGLSPEPTILITPPVLELMQLLIGHPLTPDDLTKIETQDWKIVRGEVYSLTYSAQQTLTKVELNSTHSEPAILLCSPPIDLPRFRDDPALPRLVTVHNLANFQEQIEAAMAPEPQEVNCIYEVSTHTLKYLTLTPIPQPPATFPTAAPPTTTDADELPPPLNIELRYAGDLTASQQAIFEVAAQQWSDILRNPWPAIQRGDERVEGVIVNIRAQSLDDTNGILALSAPTFLRPDSGLPIEGLIEVDLADLSRQEAEGSLLNVALHELGHVLGFGSLWRIFNVLQQTTAGELIFVGEAAMREYGDLIGTDESQPVPVESIGGPLSRGGHWRESIFGNELMSGILSNGIQPLSRVTIATFADLGYVVNYDAAQGFSLPTSEELEELGVHDPDQHRCCKCPLGLLKPNKKQRQFSLVSHRYPPQRKFLQAAGQLPIH